MRWLVGFVFLSSLVVGCGPSPNQAPGIPVVGTWNIQDSAASQGVNSQITYGDKEYQMKMTIMTDKDETATVMIKGTYEKFGGRLVTNPESVEVDNSQLSEASKQKYAPMLDKAAILANAQKNPEMEVHFEADMLIGKLKSGGEVRLRRTY